MLAPLIPREDSIFFELAGANSYRVKSFAERNYQLPETSEASGSQVQNPPGTLPGEIRTDTPHYREP